MGYYKQHIRLHAKLNVSSTWGCFLFHTKTKRSVIKCVISGRTEINYEDLVYGFNAYKQHLISVNKLLMEIEGVQSKGVDRKETILNFLFN